MYTWGTFLFFIPLFLQNILGYSPLVAGLMLLVYAALFGICSPIAGIWCDQVGYKIPIIFAALVSLLAFALLASISIQTPIYLILLGLACFGLSAGIMIPSTVNSTISSLPKASSGEGLGMFFTVAFIGTSLGVSISGAQVNIVSLHNITNLHQHVIGTLNKADFNILRRTANGTLPVTKLKTILTPESYQAISQIVRKSFITGLSYVMWLNVSFALIVTILGFALKRRSAKAKKVIH